MVAVRAGLACWIPLAALVGVACATGVPMERGTQGVTRVTNIGPDAAGVDVYTSEGTVAIQPIDAPAERVWAVLPSVYVVLGVPLSLADSTSMRIGNTGFKPHRLAGSRLSKYLNCGRGITATPNADAYEVTMSLVTRVTPVGETSHIQVEVAGNAKPRSVSGTAVRCMSKGTLESYVADLVKERLAANPT